MNSEIKKKVYENKPAGTTVNEVMLEKLNYIATRFNKITEDVTNSEGHLFVMADPVCNTKYWLRFEIPSFLSCSDEINRLLTEALTAADGYEIYPLSDKELICFDIDIDNIYMYENK